jgi:ADP-heptose:LPS heptosyltransferase
VFNFELAYLRHTNFFPPRPKRWEELKSICLGTKSRALGDALALSTLPEKLKSRNPSLRIYTFPRGLNQIVFEANPFVEGVLRAPQTVFGDDCNLGNGQLITLKENYFELPLTCPPAPQIFLHSREKSWAKQAVGPGKPLCLIHPWGGTQTKVAPVDFWDEIVKRGSERFRFRQIGLENHSAVQGCEYYHLLPPNPANTRALFALMSQAQAFIGVDSGPMHAARAFAVPSLILLSDALGRSPAEIFSVRAKLPYFLHDNWKYSPLYEEDFHISMNTAASQILDNVDDFLGKLARI